LKATEPNLIPTGTRGPQGYGMKLSTLGVRGADYQRFLSLT